MSCYEESIQVVDAIVGVGSPKPLLVSFTLNSNGTLRSGEFAVHVIHKLLAFARERHVPIRAVLFNCSEPEAITLALQQVCNDETLLRQNDHTRTCPLILGAYANRLTPVAPDWTMADSDGPQPFRTDLVPKEYYDTFVSTWINEHNVQLVGGCCGITPEHIQYLNEKIHSNN
jgi:S-methylmethionine-dependent homocysteine/selenocysteine methylase